MKWGERGRKREGERERGRKREKEIDNLETPALRLEARQSQLKLTNEETQDQT